MYPCLFLVSMRAGSCICSVESIVVQIYLIYLSKYESRSPEGRNNIGLLREHN